MKQINEKLEITFDDHPFIIIFYEAIKKNEKESSLGPTSLLSGFHFPVVVLFTKWIDRICCQSVGSGNSPRGLSPNWFKLGTTNTCLLYGLWPYCVLAKPWNCNRLVIILCWPNHFFLVWGQGGAERGDRRPNVIRNPREIRKAQCIC